MFSKREKQQVSKKISGIEFLPTSARIVKFGCEVELGATRSKPNCQSKVGSIMIPYWDESQKTQLHYKGHTFHLIPPMLGAKVSEDSRFYMDIR
jgi:hypothetical protein